MKKTLFTILALVMIAGTAAAQAPPAYGGYSAGWGMNPNNWNNYTGSYSSGLALWNPTLGGWNVNPYAPTLISYAPITLELWVELHMIQTYYYTSYQWHRIGNAAETIIFTIDGTVQSNNALLASLTVAPGTDPTKLKYVGGLPYGAGSDIGPIKWYGRVGNGLVVGAGDPAWLPLTWSSNRLDLPVLPKCDHWIQFKGEFTIPYHQDDGYYNLTLSGCPVPEM